MNHDKKYQKMAPYRIWGENLDAGAVQQMDDACSLPISIKGALMPRCTPGVRPSHWWGSGR